MLREVKPDRNETLLIVIGSGILPQIQDGKAAGRLRDEVDRKGQGLPFRWAAIVTDTALSKEEAYSRCPIIAIGGPVVNQIAARIGESHLESPQSSGNVHIQHSTRPDEKRIALWGRGADETLEAVEIFLSSELLDDFLHSIWKPS